MNRRWRAAALSAVAAGVVWSCGPRRIDTPERPAQSQTVLLPDSESGAVGRVVVSNPSGSTDLSLARESTIATAGQAPAPAVILSEADVERMFGEALSALPPPPVRFTLYFQFDSDELTDESRGLVTQILQAVKDRPAPDVVVVGHTDTTGSSASNFGLGLKRANVVRNLLAEAGLNAPSVEVATLGETDPLVATADDVAEPRNRRVEIVIR
jgi:outer membrane protein OmpA-like peptidoglycan-associated protein